MSAPFFLRARSPVGRLVRGAAGRAPAPSLSRLRAAVAALFALDGFVFGTWAARVPDVATRVGADHSTLGLALLCLSLGALACMQLTGALAARLGPGLVAALAGVAVCASAVLPGLATSVPALCAALLAFGAATGAVNVAANSVGVQVESRAGRPVLSGLHAAFSFGGLGGALLGGLAAAVLAVPAHLVVVAGAGLLLVAVLVPVLVGADAAPVVEAPVPEDAPRRRPTAVLVVLGCIAGATAYGEGALTDWGALHLREDLGATSGLAAAGYAGFALAMACGRLAGGALVARLGERRLLVGGTLLAAAGALLAVTTPSVVLALAGFGVVGLGLANVFPLAVARAGALGGSRGIALSTTVGYTGLLGGPPAIGFLAAHAGLPVALGTVALLAGAAAVLVALVDGDRVCVPAVDLAPVHRAAGDLRILAVA
ncbi:MFS transporter [Klenkia brasiliensis]|uniref:Predicted arabinose efflux permease, MFS family n=1 Tax=Klenkia brasiliensis TaxID=333142 RepID=A0A1G7TF91_9ACTN|nr:MFS transporter [Klenkia brasiliensis]SDG33230.1 Predicted arabinose efflux permease, MFS family [Klenkia brasiliensis]